MKMLQTRQARAAAIAAWLTVCVLPAWPKGVADQALSRFVLPCDRAGKADAVYECALSQAVAEDVVPASIAQACRDDLGAAVMADAHRQLWFCARLRQFGPKMPTEEWHEAATRDCEHRARRPGHRYERKRNECIADAIIEQQRVPEAAVQACRSRAGADRNSAHRLLNCLVESLRGSKTVSQAGLVFAGARTRSREACAAHAQQSTLSPEQREQFLNNCPGSTAPLAVLEQNAVQTAARLAEARQRDDAAYAPEQVRSGVRNRCESHNRSSRLVFDCACVVQEADREMAAGKLSRKTIAQGGFYWSPCIDRAQSADKIVASNFSPGLVRMYSNAGIDVEPLKACQHRAVAHDIPHESLLDSGRLGAELKQRCQPAGKR